MERPGHGLLAIGEVARRSGLRASALRYYEEAGLIAPAGRHAGKRHYDPAVLGRLAAIALLQEAGFTVAEIAELLGGRAAGDGQGDLHARWLAMAERKLRELDERAERVASARGLLVEALRCGCCDAGGCDLTRPYLSPEHRHAPVAPAGAPGRVAPPGAAPALEEAGPRGGPGSGPAGPR